MSNKEAQQKSYYDQKPLNQSPYAQSDDELIGHAKNVGQYFNQLKQKYGPQIGKYLDKVHNYINNKNQGGGNQNMSPAQKTNDPLYDPEYAKELGLGQGEIPEGVKGPPQSGPEAFNKYMDYYNKAKLLGQFINRNRDLIQRLTQVQMEARTEAQRFKAVFEETGKYLDPKSNSMRINPDSQELFTQLNTVFESLNSKVKGIKDELDSGFEDLVFKV